MSVIKLKPFFQRLKPSTVGLAYALVVLAFAWNCAQFYIPGKGFTYLIEFGDRSNATYLPELKAVNHYEQRQSSGYDGQYYAQIAMDPHLSHPQLKEAVPDLAYRARRILFCWTAYGLAGGDPVSALHIYAIQNIVAWFLLALLLLKWFPPNQWGNFFRWFSVLFTFGLTMSVRKALLDGPTLVIITLTIALLEWDKPWLAALCGGLSGLAKETSALIIGAFIPLGKNTKPWLKIVGQIIIILLPIGLWILVLTHYTAEAGGVGYRNFTYPFLGYIHKLSEIKAFLTTAPDWIIRGLFCIFISLSVQALFFFTRIRVNEAWWRLGVSYALLMLVLGDAVWEGYPGASARVLLPMTLAFNILVPRGKKWWAILVLGNLSVFVTPENLKPPGRESVIVEGPSNLRMVESTGQMVDAQFDSQWYDPEKSLLEYWRWAKASANIMLVNPQTFTIHADISFRLRANDKRVLTVTSGDQVLWKHTLNPYESQDVILKDVLLNPGTTTWHFETTSEASPDYPSSSRVVSYSVRNLRIKIIK